LADTTTSNLLAATAKHVHVIDDIIICIRVHSMENNFFRIPEWAP